MFAWVESGETTKMISLNGISGKKIIGTGNYRQVIDDFYDESRMKKCVVKVERFTIPPDFFKLCLNKTLS